MLKKINLLIVVCLFSLATLAGCQSSQSSGPEIVASAAWARPSPMMAGTGAVYMMLENRGGQADRLLGAASPAAQTVELHESLMENDVMKMRPVEGGLEIPANGKVELKPGGYHIMLIDLVDPLTVGSTIQVTLKFEVSGEMVIEVEIKQP